MPIPPPKNIGSHKRRPLALGGKAIGQRAADPIAPFRNRAEPFAGDRRIRHHCSAAREFRA
jgi:hypothetical protein